MPVQRKARLHGFTNHERWAFMENSNSAQSQASYRHLQDQEEMQLISYWKAPIYGNTVTHITLNYSSCKGRYTLQGGSSSQLEVFSSNLGGKALCSSRGQAL